jgi:hydroxypyruvate isomerase
MPRFAANLSMLFTEYPFLERFDRAAAAGFSAVEFLFPYDEDVPAIRTALTRNGLVQVLFNLPAGDFAAGDRGLANDPDRVAEFRDGVARALAIAVELQCPRLNCLSGLRRTDVSDEEQESTLASNLAYAAEQALASNVHLQIEPLNRFDAPGFMLGTSDAAVAMLDRVGHPNLALQFDVYHCQRVEGNIVETFRRHLPRIAHVQIADSPARGQPGTGEINFPFVLRAIDESGYDGWVSLEYRPQGGTEASLGWLKDWGYWT